MGQYIEAISQIIPKNNANFGIADVNHLKGGYILVDTRDEMLAFLNYTNRLKVGMLCFVVEEMQFYQFLQGTWKTWQPKSGASLSLHSVSDLDELIGSSLEIEGQVVFVRSLNSLRWYDGHVWQTFSKIYIQSTPPDDINGIWIDISTDKSINNPESIVTQLLKMINVLAKKVSLLEYRNQQIQSGTFDNNMFDLYNNIIGIDPESEISGIIDEEDADGTNEQQEYDEATLLNNTLLADSSEPTKYKDLLPNVKHILIKWGTYSDMIKYKDNFLPAELLYSYNTRELWLKDPKTYQLIKIGATQGGGSDEPEIEDIMNGIIQSGDYIGSISFVDMVNNSKHYKFTVLNGELDLECEETLTTPISSTQEKSFVQDDVQYYSSPYIPVSTKDWQNLNSLIWVHSVYSAGNKYLEGEGYNTYNPCNFDFIELCNLNFHDVNLNGFYLHYSEGAFNSNRTWISLPLRGTIKAQSTYLIKCARAGEDKFARIKVGKPDIYFSKDLALNSEIFEDSVNNYSVWDEDGMLQINKSCTFFISGPCYVTEDSSLKNDAEYTLDLLKQHPYTCQNPWIQTTAKIGVVYGYCDIVGFGTGMPSILTKPMSNLNNNSLFMQYYSLDNTKQAYKSIMASDGWATNKLWTYVDLVTPNGALKIEDYTPKASFELKNIFYNKHLLEDGKPLILNCSLGFNAHTTRCFSWVSKGYRDEYLQYKKLGDTEWITVESFKEGDNRASRGRNWDSPIYNRIRSFTSDGTYFTSHKCIIDLYDWNSDGPNSDEIYVYRVGYKDNWTDERTFTLRNRQNVIRDGFSFVQFTDQQGFNLEEYEEWRLVAEHIMDYYGGNKYQYELSPLRQDSTRLGSVPPNPKSTDTQYIIVGSWYHLTQNDSTYSYETSEAPQEGTYSNAASLPTAQEGADEYIFVGKSYELVKEKLIQFSINTGDATQNGNRINEWVDYFIAGTSVFNKLEQQYTVGNNDLCPIIPQELGTGDDTTKVNPKNVEFFFTFEHPFEIPRSVNGTYVPSVYTYLYGDTLFMSMNSELTDSKNDACLALYGEQSYDLQQRLKTWAQNELTDIQSYMQENGIGVIVNNSVRVPRWKIAFCHESPFTLVIQSVLSDYKGRKTQDETYKAPDRGTVTSHFNSPGGYWFSKFLEDNEFNMCICGHKHTYTTSRYLHDNEDDRMQPYVYDPAGDLASFINEDNRLFMKVTNDTTKNYVKYTMCQASGYKLTSNKELPGRNIGWLEQYYPGVAVAGDTSSVTVNTNQRYPHYIIWTIGSGVETENPSVNTTSRERILGKTWKVQSGLSGQTGNNKMYNYNTRIFYAKDIQRLGGNGDGNSGLNNIIVEKLPKTIPAPVEPDESNTENSVYSVVNAELTGNDGDQVTLLNNN